MAPHRGEVALHEAKGGGCEAQVDGGAVLDGVAPPWKRAASELLSALARPSARWASPSFTASAVTIRPVRMYAMPFERPIAMCLAARRRWSSNQ